MLTTKAKNTFPLRICSRCGDKLSDRPDNLRVSCETCPRWYHSNCLTKKKKVSANFIAYLHLYWPQVCIFESWLNITIVYSLFLPCCRNILFSFRLWNHAHYLHPLDHWLPLGNFEKLPLFVKIVPKNRGGGGSKTGSFWKYYTVSCSGCGNIRLHFIQCFLYFCFLFWVVRFNRLWIFQDFYHTQLSTNNYRFFREAFTCLRCGSVLSATHTMPTTTVVQVQKILFRRYQHFTPF